MQVSIFPDLQLIHIDSEVLLKTGDFFPEKVTEPLVTHPENKVSSGTVKQSFSNKDSQAGAWEPGECVKFISLFFPYPKFVGFVLKTRKKVLFGALLLFQISVITHHRFSDS
ncbi:hypothetical protein [Candidatus Electrothrix sp.]|uniref:hypothetical protein n=1 Tax=Candidatus Electrothrix sp. TaxID=2170559 RepID=UPI004055DF70